MKNILTILSFAALSVAAYAKFIGPINFIPAAQLSDRLLAQQSIAGVTDMA